MISERREALLEKKWIEKKSQVQAVFILFIRQCSYWFKSIYMSKLHITADLVQGYRRLIQNGSKCSNSFLPLKQSQCWSCWRWCFWNSSSVGLVDDDVFETVPVLVLLTMTFLKQFQCWSCWRWRFLVVVFSFSSFLRLSSGKSSWVYIEFRNGVLWGSGRRRRRRRKHSNFSVGVRE